MTVICGIGGAAPHLRGQAETLECLRVSRGPIVVTFTKIKASLLVSMYVFSFHLRWGVAISVTPSVVLLGERTLLGRPNVIVLQCFTPQKDEEASMHKEGM